jgi:hypothetical protein
MTTSLGAAPLVDDTINLSLRVSSGTLCFGAAHSQSCCKLMKKQLATTFSALDELTSTSVDPSPSLGAVLLHGDPQSRQRLESFLSGLTVDDPSPSSTMPSQQDIYFLQSPAYSLASMPYDAGMDLHDFSGPAIHYYPQHTAYDDLAPSPYFLPYSQPDPSLLYLNFPANAQ